MVFAVRVCVCACVLCFGQGMARAVVTAVVKESPWLPPPRNNVERRVLGCVKDTKESRGAHICRHLNTDTINTHPQNVVIQLDLVLNESLRDSYMEQK